MESHCWLARELVCAKQDWPQPCASLAKFAKPDATASYDVHERWCSSSSQSSRALCDAVLMSCSRCQESLSRNGCEGEFVATGHDTALVSQLWENGWKSESTAT